MCCICITLASFQFGYNISALNSPSNLIKSFIKDNAFIFDSYYEQVESHKSAELFFWSNIYHDAKGEHNTNHFNSTIDYKEENLEDALLEEKYRLETVKSNLIQAEINVNEQTELIWTILNCLFVLGGMSGAFGSKFIMDRIGRKMSMVLHNFFSLTASVLVASSTYFSSPVLLLISRFLFGLQGGFACNIVPTYLSEIAPNRLRGRVGVLHQLFITLGIVSSQIIGFRQLLGSQTTWNYLLAVPFIPALIGCVTMLLFFPESPKALLIRNKNDMALEALRILRNEFDVELELEEMALEMKKGNKTDKVMSIIGLFGDKELRVPLFTSLVLQASMQLCGINAVN